ncbi:hypothetical protein Zmor_001389 [Zophobas morio]|uniref:Uncharacterized protein n=1 Tax=Zophobas morio TaxID=2755281 RepID=A0AA38IZ13_9CUCU|nr:hypothetical protein Zmor_001389 [Zophobas morio]
MEGSKASQKGWMKISSWLISPNDQQNEGKIDRSRFHQVTTFLKTASAGYVPKKSLVFTREDLENFLDTDPNEKYLLLKVVAIMGIAEGCRIKELISISVDDIDDRGSVLVVQIPDTKTYKNAFLLSSMVAIPSMHSIRSSATLLADSGVDLSVLKKHGE